MVVTLVWCLVDRGRLCSGGGGTEREVMWRPVAQWTRGAVGTLVRHRKLAMCALSIDSKKTKLSCTVTPERVCNGKAYSWPRTPAPCQSSGFRILSGAAGPFRTESLAYSASRRRTMRLATWRSREVAPRRTAAPRCAAVFARFGHLFATSADHIDSQ